MAIQDGVLKKILEYGVRAPSGDNCQPWRFAASGNRLLVLDDPGRDTSLYNVRNAATLIAHGALIETLSIAATAFGLKADVRLFPGGKDETASIAFSPDEAPPDALYAYIHRRTTNRFPYRKRPLDPGAADALAASASPVPGARVALREDREGRRKAARVASVNDRLLFEVRGLHDFLFAQIRWSAREAEATGDGMDIRTLGLNPLQQRLFRLLKPWPMVRALNCTGLSRMVPLQSYMLCSGSAAMGLLTAKGTSPESFINGGRALQRLWLTAASLGLSFQPMAGITFLIQRLYLDGGRGLEGGHRRIVEAAERRLREVFPSTRGDAIVMLFRTGYAAPPAVGSLRRPVTLR